MTYHQYDSLINIEMIFQRLIEKRMVTADVLNLFLRSPMQTFHISRAKIHGISPPSSLTFLFSHYPSSFSLPCHLISPRRYNNQFAKQLYKDIEDPWSPTLTATVYLLFFYYLIFSLFVLSFMNGNIFTMQHI